ncbi:MAG: class I SAM-dependent methyltransferase, partial [Saprospiraceae bacterium]
MSHNWRSFYSREAAEYDARRYRSWYGRLFSHLHHEAVNQALQSVPADSMILEVASGTGHNLPVLSPHGRLVIASDLTIDMLKVSQKNLSTCGNFAYVVNDAFRLPFPDAQFDIVISSRFLHLFSPAQQQTLIAEMARVL